MTQSVLHQQTSRITAIVVSFQPREPDLTRLVRAIRSQVKYIVVVDNGSDSDRSPYRDAVTDEVTEIVRLGQNFGIAYAHNVGIRWAEARDSTHVLLLD